MLDIDRNINSSLYETDDNIYKKININTDVKNNSKLIYSKTVSALNGASISTPTTILGPGEYYYRHKFFLVESNNDMFLLYTNNRDYPFCSYRQNSPVSGLSVVIPCSFNLSTTAEINVAIIFPGTQNYNINSIIEIYKRVK